MSYKMTGCVFSVNTSKEKGVPKKPVEKVFLKEDFGLISDAHSGVGLRQVSLLAIEDIRDFSRTHFEGRQIPPGRFGENITLQGVGVRALKAGDRLVLAGGALLEITQIGKECHAPCSIAQDAGHCLMPEAGVFAVVRKAGELRAGDDVAVEFKNGGRQ